jgi:hypothetical protein
MTRNVDAYQSLRSAGAAALNVFALGCAERGSGIFERLATEGEKEWFSRILELAWSAVSGEGDEGDLAEVVEEFQERAEYFDSDEHNKDFYVVQSAMLAVNAIAVHLNPTPARTEMSGQTLETLLGDFDFRLSGEQAVIVRAGEPNPPIGRLQQMEQDAQNATLRALSELGDQNPMTQEFLDSVRESCRPVRDEIASATAQVAERAGWEANDA